MTNFSFFISQFTFISHFSLTKLVTENVWKMIPDKLLVNGKCKLENCSRKAPNE